MQSTVLHPSSSGQADLTILSYAGFFDSHSKVNGLHVQQGRKLTRVQGRRSNYSAAVSVRTDGVTKPSADGEAGLLNSITPPPPPPHGTKSAEDMRWTDRVTMWGPKPLGSREVPQIGVLQGCAE